MPGRKRFTRRRAPPRRRIVRKTKKMVTGQGPTLLEKIASGIGGVATVAKAVLPIVAAINTEAKYYDYATTVSAYNPGTNDQIIPLTGGISNGTTDTTRIGNSLLAKDLNIRFSAYWLASTTVYVGETRMIIFAWKENYQDNPPTAAKLFETPADLRSGFNKDYTDQFVVIKDKTFAHNAHISAAVTQGIISSKFYKKLDFHLRFDGTTNVDYTQNHIFMCIRGGGATSANASTVQLYSRLNFTDN